MRENGPSGKENEVVHWSEAEILSGVEFEDIGDADVPLGLIQREELVGAEEGRKGCECFHDDIAADDDCEDKLLEEALDHPWVDRLSAHEELGCQAQLAQEEAEELASFDSIELFIIPQLALAFRQAGP